MRTQQQGVRHHFLPRLEVLEHRNCPTVNITVIGNTMFIKGDSSANTVTIDDDGAGNVDATITGDDNTDTDSASGIKNIVVNLGRGDDSLLYTLGGDLTTSRTLTVTLGKETNDATFDFSGGAIDANLLAVAVFGGRHVDTVDVLMGEVNDTAVAVTAYLDRGDDAFTGTLSGDILGDARVKFFLFGASGNDTIDVDASAGVGVEEDAVLKVVMDGGTGDDNLSTTYLGDLDGKLAVSATGFWGDDTIAADLTAEEGSTGLVTALVGGGLGDDDLTLNVNDNSGGDVDVFALLDGGIFGDDTCTATDNVVVINCEN